MEIVNVVFNFIVLLIGVSICIILSGLLFYIGVNLGMQITKKLGFYIPAYQVHYDVNPVDIDKAIQIGADRLNKKRRRKWKSDTKIEKI